MAFATSTSWFPLSKAKDLNNSTKFITATKKIMIVTAIPTGEEEFLDDLTEYAGTGYTAGYGNSGRKSLAGTFLFTGDIDITNLSVALTYSTTAEWSSLGTNGDEIVGFVILTETGGSDATSIPWIWMPVADGTFVLTGVTQTLTFPNPILTERLAS